MKQIVRIGIDPDVDKSGYCLIFGERFKQFKIQALKNLEMFGLFEEIKSDYQALKDNNDFLVCLEAGWLNAVSNYHGAKSKAIAAKIGKNVGENHCIGKTIEKFLIKENIPYKLIKPNSRKWDSETFFKITKFAGRTNSEQRDAARAAWI